MFTLPTPTAVVVVSSIEEKRVNLIKTGSVLGRRMKEALLKGAGNVTKDPEQSSTLFFTVD